MLQGYCYATTQNESQVNIPLFILRIKNYSTKERKIFQFQKRKQKFRFHLRIVDEVSFIQIIAALLRTQN